MLYSGFIKKVVVMKKSNFISKIFFWVAGAFFVCAFVLLFAHTFYNDKYSNAIHGFNNPGSEFLVPDKTGASILMVSDTGSNDILLRAIIDNAFRSKKYDFVMYLGDLTKNASITGYYWMLDEIKPSLGNVPMYTIPGNHEISRRIGMSHSFFKDKSFYETVMGARYYWFGYGNTLFVTLDSSDETLDDKQLVWLENTLKKIRPMFRNCIIIGHVPPANSRPDFFADHIMTADTNKKFESIIKKYKINAMFFGHVHFYSRGSFAGVDFYTTPSSGQSIRDLENPQYGYMSVDIDKNGKVSVMPGYIDFVGQRRHNFAEWFARDVLSVRVRMVISVALILSLVSLVIGFVFRSRR